MPKVVIANALRTGQTVFLTEQGWSADIRNAAVATDPASEAALLEAAAVDARRNIILDAYAIDCTVEDGRLVPVHLRERLRMLGPSVRPDLGMQAVLKG